MIVWPDEATIPTVGRDGLAVVRASGACAELEAEPARWRVAAWPWSHEAPLRVRFMNDANDEVTVTLDEDGMWRVEAEAFHVRERTEEELAADARAEVVTPAPGPS